MSYGGVPAAQEQRCPRVVEVGASLLAIAGLLIVGRVAYGVLVNLGLDGWSSGARAVFLVLNSIMLVFGLFLLVLAYHVWRGRQWARIVSLVMLPLAILNCVVLLVTAVNGDVPLVGTGLLVASLAAMLVLTVPRTARDYFARKPAPTAPLQAGAFPGHPWGPGHPPAEGVVPARHPEPPRPPSPVN